MISPRLPHRAFGFAVCLAALASGISSAPAAITRDAAALPVLKQGAWDTLKLTWENAEKDENNDHGSPIGNGTIGAKIKGGVEKEILQLNDKTFWSGGPSDQRDPKRRDALVETRKKLAAGDIPGANQAARAMWGPSEPGSYLPIGKLYLDFDGLKDSRNYQRVLDLDQALSTVSFTSGGVKYKRETFASFPDRVIVMRLGSSGKGKITFTARLAIPKEMEGHGSVATDGQNILVMKGQAPTFDRSKWDPAHGMTFESRLQIKTTGGRVTSQNGTLRVEGADEALLLFADATSYAGPTKDPGTEGVKPGPLVKATLAAAAAKTYDQLFAAHVKDFQSLFRRLWVEINREKPNKYALAYQYARYEMISVSRLGDRPHNQQGMWTPEWIAMSNSCHFLNENVEKYYGLIETGNIAETGVPLWNWISELAQNGTITAKTDWGFRGWLAPHYSDVWATTTLKGGNNEWTIWPVGGIWLCQLLWDHYAFGLDRNYLEKAYPILKGASEFALDLLVDDGKGHLVTSPSTSPENQFRLVPDGPTYAVSQGSTMDIALIRELFENTISAAKILGLDPDFQAELAAARAKLLPFQIGKNGELQEWSQDFPKRDDGHRHASHVVAVWPLRQITHRDPKLFAAAKLALDNRGGGGYHPDKGAMYARLDDGDKAITSKDSFPTGTGIVGQFPPKYSGFCELFVQSQAGEIELLPALPKIFTSGKLDGVRARGGYQLSIEWANGRLTKCRIDSPFGTVPVVRSEGKLVNLATDSRVTVNLLKPAAVTR